MSDRWHKLAVALEALLLAAPVTYLGGIFGLMSLVMLVGGSPLEPYDQAQTFVYLLPLTPLLAGWVLIVHFLIKGRPGLSAASSYLWWLSGLGIVIILAAILVTFVDLQELNDHPTMWLWVVKYFRELVFGLPAVVPLIHLMLLRKAPSNNALQVDVPRPACSGRP